MHASRISRHASRGAEEHVTCHVSHVTLNTSHVTRHASHVTRHASQVTFEFDNSFAWMHSKTLQFRFSCCCFFDFARAHFCARADSAWLTLLLRLDRLIFPPKFNAREISEKLACKTCCIRHPHNRHYSAAAASFVSYYNACAALAACACACT